MKHTPINFSQRAVGTRFLAIAIVASPAASAHSPVFGVGHRNFTAPPETAWAASVAAVRGPDGPVLFLVGLGIDAGVSGVGAVLETADGYSEPILGPAPPFGRPHPLVSMLTGDYDGDGHPDLYLWDRIFSATETMKVVPFDGATFGAAIDLGYPIHQGPGSVDGFEDLDGDGRADVVFQHSPTRLGVSWSSRPGVPPELLDVGFEFQIAAVTDLDGDDRPDVLLRNASAPEFRVYPGTGTDGFGPVRTVGLPANDTTAGVLDLTGDGRPDIALGSNDSMTVLVNEGGTFSPVVLPVEDGVRTVRPVGDFDDDGLPDVIVRTRAFPRPGNELEWVWRNPVLGYDRSSLWLVEGRTGTSLARDMNGDGLRDMVTLGDALTVDHRSIGPGGDRLGAVARDVRRDPRHVEAADLDGDGVPELIVTGRIAPKLYRRGPDGAYTEEDIPGAETFMSRVADFNADGVADLVVSSGQDTVDFSPGVPGGFFGPLVQFSLPVGATTHQLTVGDFNADGVSDFAVAGGAARAVFIFHGRQGEAPTLVHAIPVGGEAVGLCAVDVDHDGWPDLVVGDAEGRTVKILSNGGAQWSVGASWDTTTPPAWLSAGDLDADGFTDVLVSTHGWPLRVLFGGLAGPQDPVSLYGVPMVAQGAFIEHTVVDLTGNGLLDIVAATNASTPGVWVYTQVAPGQFAFGGRVPGPSATGCAVADLDADGALDIVTVSGAFTRGVMTMSYGIPAACPADLNANGMLNFFDLARFVALYQQQDAAADVNGDGLFNFFDFSAYLAAFNAGCP